MSSTLLLVPNKYFLKKCNRKKKSMMCSSSISFRILGLASEETIQFGDDEMSIKGEKSDDD